MGQKQSRSSYMARGVLHPIFGCPCVRFVKVTGYSSTRGPRSKRAISRSAQSHQTTATKDGAQTETHFMRACVYTARKNRLPCTSDVLWTVKFWKLLNQNLTIQATESNERYPRSTVFNVLEGQTERFVANDVQFLRNNPLSGKLYTLHDFCLCKITTANDIQKKASSGPALSIVQYIGN